MIVFGPWLPDQPHFRPEKAFDVLNVIPHEQGYHPWQTWEMVIPAPTAGQNPLSCNYFIASSGVIYNILGTQNKLFKLSTAGTAWDDATRTSGGNYSTPAEGAWSLTQFDDHIFGVNKQDTPQRILMPAGANFQAASYPSGPPAGSKFVATVRRFVVAANTNANEREVAWSGLGEPLAWSPSAVTLADSQILPTHGAITGLVGGDYGVIFQQHALQRMTFSGPPNAFEFERISTTLGLDATRSLAQYGDVIFCYSTSGVKLIRGAQEIADIGEGKVDTWLSDNIDDSDLWRITGTIDVKNKLYLMAVPIDDVQSLCDLILAYHWPTGEWSKIGFINYLLCTFIPQTSYHLDNVDNLIGNNIDTVSWSFDSPTLISTGVPQVAAFASTAELGFFKGIHMPATILTGDIPLVPGKKALVRALRPMFEGEVEGLACTPHVHDRLQDVPLPKATAAVNRNGFCPIRANGRYHRFQINTAEGGDWEHALGVDDLVISEMAR